jgi:hypothetical protein
VNFSVSYFGAVVLIGFAPNARHATDEDVLAKMNCERVFTAAHGFFHFNDVANYLRPGDALAVVSLLRLSADVGELVHIVGALKKMQVSLCVPDTDITPEHQFGMAFMAACNLLAELFPLDPDLKKIGLRGRGRPSSLPAEMQAQARHLLKNGRNSVADVAKLLNVSPATIYRYFPRTGNETNGEDHPHLPLQQAPTIPGSPRHK